jgi:hypothetical protein
LNWAQAASLRQRGEWEVKFANSKIKLYFCSIKIYTF